MVYIGSQEDNYDFKHRGKRTSAHPHPSNGRQKNTPSPFSLLKHLVYQRSWWNCSTYLERCPHLLASKRINKNCWPDISCHCPNDWRSMLQKSGGLWGWYLLFVGFQNSIILFIHMLFNIIIHWWNAVDIWNIKTNRCFKNMLSLVSIWSRYTPENEHGYPQILVWKRQLPLNMAILGIYLRFLGCTSKDFTRISPTKKKNSPWNLKRMEVFSFRRGSWNMSSLSVECHYPPVN